MRSSQRSAETSERFEGSNLPHVKLFKYVSSDYADSKAGKDMSTLWAKLAPAGNIYRYMAARAERMKHCHDLNKQLYALAESKKEILGPNASVEERVQSLRDAMATVKVQRSLADVEAEADKEDDKGFLPLSEFINDGVAQFGPFIYPSDPEEYRAWRFNRFLAFIVFLVQVTGPVMIVLHKWESEDNNLRNPATLWNIFSIEEALCTGTDWTGRYSTVLGTLFLIMLTIVIRQYINDEIDNNDKLSRLPVDSFWSSLGIIANGLCCFFLVFALPLEYFAESSDGPTAIIMNSMALMFIFTLDDLAGDVFGYIGEEDSDFQRKVSWYYSLLSNCPVRIADLINPSATSAENIWQISYGPKGRLLCAQAGSSGSGGVSRGSVGSMDSQASSVLPTTPQLCLTRISPASDDETTSLMASKNFGGMSLDEELAEMRVSYRIQAGGQSHVLPGCLSTVKHAFWNCILFVVTVMQFLGPVFFFVFNNACGLEHKGRFDKALKIQ